jgi:hypothetical protein
MTFIVNGRVRLAVTDETGGIVPVRTLESGDFLLVSKKPMLLQDFGRAIEERRESLRRALAAAQD